MDQLQLLLNGLGPWGVLAGAVLMLAVQYFVPKLKPANPANPAPVVPVTPAPATDTPILDAVLNLLRLKLLNQSGQAPAVPVTRDIDHSTAAQLLGVPVDVGKVK